MATGKVSLILLGVLLAPAIARADLSSSQAKKLITKTAGMSLPSGSVRIVRKPITMDPNVAEAIVEIDLVFRMSRHSSGAWRIAEVRTGQEAWESLDSIGRAVGGQLPASSCQNKNQFQQPVASDLTVRQARCLVAALFGVELPNDAVRIKSISGFAIPGASEPSATVVSLVRFGVRFNRDKAGWHTSSFKTNGRWISVGEISQSLAVVKSEQARDEMNTVATALLKFRQDRGTFVVSDKYPVLIDHLSPTYLARVIRFDPWGKSYEYAGEADHFTLRSSGPDRKMGTGDDEMLSGGAAAGRSSSRTRN